DLVLIWFALLVALVALAGKPLTGGPLVLSYFLGVSLIHLPGALIYLDPLSIAPTPRETELGFRLTVIGLAAVLVGAGIARSPPHGTPVASTEAVVARFGPQIWPLAIAGFVTYVFIMPRANAIPSGTALVSSLGSLMIIGLWLRFYVASVTGNTKQLF